MKPTRNGDNAHDDHRRQPHPLRPYHRCAPAHFHDRRARRPRRQHAARERRRRGAGPHQSPVLRRHRGGPRRQRGRRDRGREDPRGDRGGRRGRYALLLRSWGNLWATCAASDDGAEAFGPCGTALRIDPATVGLVVTNENATAWAAAQALGLVVRGEEGELDTLHPTFVAAFHANPGDIVVVPPPSLRQYLDGDDGSVARHAATEGARARARVEFDKQYQPRDEAGRLLAECIHCGEPLPRDGAGNLPAACPGCGATEA